MKHHSIHLLMLFSLLCAITNTKIIAGRGHFRGVPAESGVVWNVDIADVGLAGGVEGVSGGAGECQVGVVNSLVDARRV